MTNEEVKTEIIKALVKLAGIDCKTRDEHMKVTNQKRIHEAYNILDDLRKRL